MAELPRLNGIIKALEEGGVAFVGSAPPDKKGSPHHSPTFDIDEESLVIGAELVTRTAVRYLEQSN